ncbi:myrosinase 1-like isoform X1 [Neodiprion lecontei]|uniref:Myrosinase 1-like isoform X1 n=1 Tax=Neodiprion lecontei TaxID=441921 RepID=A0ABM3GE34_NEOLC|nr:myrosinase 1-like isoform X1 [Neodiprion lecontei]
MDCYFVALIICLVLATVSCCDIVKLTFPSGFRFGAATASYQIEGAWNVSVDTFYHFPDKGENVWDYWTHNYPGYIADGTNGDIACDSYHKYEEDVQLLKSAGLDFYRFSISWSRVLPTGFTNVISEDGLQYYKNLTAELVANGIEPIVTIYHWDHPQVIEDMGGWTNELMVDWFVDYARVLFEALGDTVKKWITINEPRSFCLLGYEDTQKAPGKVISGIGAYLCMHNVLKAHGKTYRMYDEEFRDVQQGVIGMAFSLITILSANSSDTVSADVGFQFEVGWNTHPIYIGDYPEIMKTRVAMISEAQGYPRSRLPELTDDWIAIINGSSDFFGANLYTSVLASPDPDEELGIYNSDSGIILEANSSWSRAASSWLYVYPPGFGYTLRQIRDYYDNPPVWITENGYSDKGELEDYDRISYFYDYLRELLIALKRDGCDIRGYAIWSLMDNFEWQDGIADKFGIYSVDFDDPARTRSSKLSTAWWARVTSTRKLQAVPTNSNARIKLPWE